MLDSQQVKGTAPREVEANGVTIVPLALVRELAVEIKAPRMLYLHWPFGHALGKLGNRDQQRTILHDAFSLARIAQRHTRVSSNERLSQYL